MFVTIISGIYFKVIKLQKSGYIALSLVILFLATLSPAHQEKGADAGPMEKAGAAADQGVEATKRYLRDAAITARVKHRLFADDEISLLKLKVLTRDGVVFVNGTVASHKIAERIMEIVRSTEGVVRAKNKLNVTQIDY